MALNVLEGNRDTFSWDFEGKLIKRLFIYRGEARVKIICKGSRSLRDYISRKLFPPTGPKEAREENTVYLKACQNCRSCNLRRKSHCWNHDKVKGEWE